MGTFRWFEYVQAVPPQVGTHHQPMIHNEYTAFDPASHVIGCVPGPRLTPLGL